MYLFSFWLQGLAALCERRGFSTLQCRALVHKHLVVLKLKRESHLWELSTPSTLTASPIQGATGVLASQSRIFNPSTWDLSITWHFLFAGMQTKDHPSEIHNCRHNSWKGRAFSNGVTWPLFHWPFCGPSLRTDGLTPWIIHIQMRYRGSCCGKNEPKSNDILQIWNSRLQSLSTPLYEVVYRNFSWRIVISSCELQKSYIICLSDEWYWNLYFLCVWIDGSTFTTFY